MRLIATPLFVLFLIKTASRWPVSFGGSVSGGLSSFSKTKTELNAHLPSKTWYCDCLISNHKVGPCNLGIRYDKSIKIEWDHVVPAAVFPRPKKCSGEGLQVKTSKTRDCARRLSRSFSLAEADPVNLVAAESAVNQLKGARLPGISFDVFRSSCGFEISSSVFNPPAHLRGDVARIWFHMNKKHFHGRLIHGSLGMILYKWAKDDPISIEEINRSQQLKTIGGNHLFVRPK